MGRRANNPDLVDKLVKERWTMDDDKFEEKFNSLSFSDRGKIMEVIDEMEHELLTSGHKDDFEEYSGYDDWKGSHP